MISVTGSAIARIISLTIVAVSCFDAVPVLAQGMARDLVRERVNRMLEQRASRGRLPEASPRGSAGQVEKYKIAGLEVAVWEPPERVSRVPLVLFSHGFHGRNTQSGGLASAMADAGYLVMAPNHQDAIGNGLKPPVVPFKQPALWSERTFKDRGIDICRLLEALHKDPVWSARIDWTRVALCGHSLGGYTCLALAGAWPAWKLPGIKAVLALSPYLSPFLLKGTLRNLGMPVMYQGGTRDVFISPHLRKSLGAYEQTSSPAYLVEFVGASHFAWTNLNKDEHQQELIVHYCLAFLDRYVKGDPRANPGAKLKGVFEVRAK